MNDICWTTALLGNQIRIEFYTALPVYCRSLPVNHYSVFLNGVSLCQFNSAKNPEAQKHKSGENRKKITFHTITLDELKPLGRGSGWVTDRSRAVKRPYVCCKCYSHLVQPRKRCPIERGCGWPCAVIQVFLAHSNYSTIISIDLW